MRKLNYLAIDEEVVNGETYESDPMIANFVFYASAIALASNSTTGTLKFQASNESVKTGTPTIWKDIPSQTVSVNADGVFIIPKFDVCYEWLKLVFVASADGTLRADVKLSGA